MGSTVGIVREDFDHFADRGQSDVVHFAGKSCFSRDFHLLNLTTFRKLPKHTLFKVTFGSKGNTKLPTDGSLAKI